MSLPTWVEQAVCATRPDLPWVAETRPIVNDIVAMKSMCENCPVRKRCAVEALAAGPAGGFYAGFWMPWSSVDDVGGVRTHVRRQLKDIAGLPRVGRPRGRRQPYVS